MVWVEGTSVFPIALQTVLGDVLKEFAVRKLGLGFQSSAPPFGVYVRVLQQGFLLCNPFRRTLLQNPKGSAEFWGGGRGSLDPSFEDRHLSSQPISWTCGVSCDESFTRRVMTLLLLLLHRNFMNPEDPFHID